MQRIYQWFRRRAITYRGEMRSREGRRTLRKEVTVLREEKTLFVGTALHSLGICPFCGQELLPARETAVGEPFQLRSNDRALRMNDSLKARHE
jgi:hypothetical protein